MKKILILLVVILIGLQFIPVERNNPPVTGEIDAPGNIISILKTSCYDCHSNETTWPWYSYVAPVSFLIADDVKKGRRNVNFSEWDKYDGEKKEKILEELIEEVEGGTMPLFIYSIIQPKTKMDPLRINTLANWVNKKGGMGKTLRQEKVRE